MSTRHKGARVQDYAAMLKRNPSSPQNVKLTKNGDGVPVKIYKKGNSRGKGGLGFADSDEEREGINSQRKTFEDQTEQHDEEGEHEQND